jgi:hypothetical protein
MGIFSFEITIAILVTIRVRTTITTTRPEAFTTLRLSIHVSCNFNLLSIFGLNCDVLHTPLIPPLTVFHAILQQIHRDWREPTNKHTIHPISSWGFLNVLIIPRWNHMVSDLLHKGPFSPEADDAS